MTSFGRDDADESFELAGAGYGYDARGYNGASSAPRGI